MMNIYVLDTITRNGVTSIEVVSYVEDFKSFIWTDRYDEPGEFELQTKVTGEALDLYRLDRYILNDESRHLMIIEVVEIDSSLDDGDELIVRGRSLESILDRRIVWGTETFYSNIKVQLLIEQLLYPAFMDPKSADRFVPAFKFINNEDLKQWPILEDDDDSDVFGAQYTGDNLLELINNICVAYRLGFELLRGDPTVRLADGTFQSPECFYFRLYKGTNRSYNNAGNNGYVVFSPEFDNVFNSNYIYSKNTYKTVALIYGEQNESTKISYKQTTYADEQAKGLHRREMFIDGSGINRTINMPDGSSKTLTQKEYLKLLNQKAKEELSNNTVTETLESDVDTQKIFVYGRDFFIGDVVQIVDAYGNTYKSRVSEIVYSYTPDEGYTAYPSFEIISEEEADAFCY